MNTYKQCDKKLERLISVNGKGMVKVTPDRAEIHISVISQHEELSTAQQQNAKNTQQVIDALLRMGIPHENIQTANYTILPQYDQDQNDPHFHITGYQVSHSIILNVLIEEVGQIINTSIQSGANRIQNISFVVSREEQYYQYALQFAMQNAYLTAQTIANTAKVTLNPIPKQVTERSYHSPKPFQTYSSLESTNTIIEPGLFQIEAEVDITFSITI